MEDIKCTLKTVQVDGKEYLTTSQFGAVCGRSAKTINHLILYGNKVRKMKSILQFGVRLIPIEELDEFPFTSKGRYGWQHQHTARSMTSDQLPGVDDITV